MNLKLIQERYEHGGMKQMGFVDKITNKKEDRWVSFYNEGGINGIQFYKNGIKHGKHEGYQQNAELGIKGQYENGKIEGVWEHYNEDGILIKKEAYSNGKFIGNDFILKSEKKIKEKLAAFIFDLDGFFDELVDESLACENCKTFEDVAFLLKSLICSKIDMQIIFLTSRSEEYREETIEWIEENIYTVEEINDFALIMKKAYQENFSEVSFKSIEYSNTIQPLYDVKGVFENCDSSILIKMWEAIGLKCYTLPKISKED